MSVKRIRCTDDAQKRGIATLRDAMKDASISNGLHRKLERALQSFDVAHLAIKEVLKRAEAYQKRDLEAKNTKALGTKESK
jgi:hypothetical protein